MMKKRRSLLPLGSRWTVGFASIVSILSLAATVFAIEDGPQFDLGRAWVTDRVIRLVAASAALPENERQSAFDTALKITDEMRRSQPEIRDVGSLEELEALRNRYLRSEDTLELEANRLRDRSPPRRLILVSSVADVAAALTRAQDATASLDVALPRPWWVSVANWFGLFRTDQTKLLALLMENSRASRALWWKIRRTSDERKAEAISLVLADFNERLEEARGLGRTALANSQLNFDDPVLQSAVEIVIEEYFKGLSRERLAKMALAVLSRPEQMDPMSIFRRAARESGPHFGKIFQMLGQEDGFPAHLKETFKTFEDELPPSSESYAREAQRKIEADLGKNFEHFDLTPVKVGTMYQIHKAKLNGRWVAVRILKFGMREAVAEDDAAIDRIAARMSENPRIMAKLPTLITIIRQVKRMVAEEFNLAKATAAQNEARSAYAYTRRADLSTGDPEIVFRVPSIIASDDKQYQVMEWVEGIGFNQILEQNAPLARTALSLWARVWLKEAFFGKGFVHVDPQRGNLKFHLAPNRLTVAPLDYGMTSRAEPKLRDGFALIAIGGHFEDATLIAEGLLAVSAQNSGHDRSTLSKLVEDAIRERKSQGAKLDPEFLVGLGARSGIEFVDGLYDLARAYGTMVLALRKADVKVDAGKILVEIIKENPSHLQTVRAAFSGLPIETQGRLTKLLIGGGARYVVDLLTNAVSSFGGSVLLSQGKQNGNGIRNGDTPEATSRVNLNRLSNWLGRVGLGAPSHFAPTASSPKRCADAF